MSISLFFLLDMMYEDIIIRMPMAIVANMKMKEKVRILAWPLSQVFDMSLAVYLVGHSNMH